jgi:hypothetical protein
MFTKSLTVTNIVTKSGTKRNKLEQCFTSSLFKKSRGLVLHFFLFEQVIRYHIRTVMTIIILVIVKIIQIIKIHMFDYYNYDLI